MKVNIEMTTRDVMNTLLSYWNEGVNEVKNGISDVL